MPETEPCVAGNVIDSPKLLNYPRSDWLRRCIRFSGEIFELLIGIRTIALLLLTFCPGRRRLLWFIVACSLQLSRVERPTEVKLLPSMTASAALRSLRLKQAKLAIRPQTRCGV